MALRIINYLNIFFHTKTQFNTLIIPTFVPKRTHDSLKVRVAVSELIVVERLAHFFMSAALDPTGTDIRSMEFRSLLYLNRDVNQSRSFVENCTFSQK